MGNLKVTITHGHGGGNWIWALVVIAALAMMVSAAAPAVAVTMGVAVAGLALAQTVAFWLLGIACAAGLIFVGVKIPLMIKEHKAVGEYLAKEEERRTRVRTSQANQNSPTHRQINAERVTNGIPPIGLNGETLMIKGEAVRLDR